MRPTLAVTGLLLALAGLLLTATCADAQSLPRRGSITLYGFAGGINQEMGDVNDVLNAQQEILRQGGFSANYDIFGLTWIYGGGAWFQMAKRISIGAEYSYQNQDLQNDVFGEFFLVDGDPPVQDSWFNGAGGKLETVTFTLTWYPPLDKGIFIGGGVGYGKSSMYQEIEFNRSGEPELWFRDRGDYTADGVVGQAFLGYHFNFVWGTRLQIKGGYRYSVMTGLEGTTTRTTNDPNGGTITQPRGQALPLGEVDWDFSGWNANIVLGIPFFGSDDE